MAKRYVDRHPTTCVVPAVNISRRLSSISISELIALRQPHVKFLARRFPKPVCNSALHDKFSFIRLRASLDIRFVIAAKAEWKLQNLNVILPDTP